MQSLRLFSSHVPKLRLRISRELSSMAAASDSSLTFSSEEEHTTWLESVSSLPLGFSAGATTLEFQPR